MISSFTRSMAAIVPIKINRLVQSLDEMLTFGKPGEPAVMASSFVPNSGWVQKSLRKPSTAADAGSDCR
jgi:hypothetical protein